MYSGNHNKGIFIGFIGVPGVGKTSVATALANELQAQLFIEPGEEFWPIDHSTPWQKQVDILENWVCESNFQNFQKARQLADEGNITIADAGIFLVNKELIYDESNNWWYGLIPPEKKSLLYKKAESDWLHAPCPDVLVLFETSQETWLRFIQERNRSTDQDETCLNNYPGQKTHMAKVAEQFASDRGIAFLKFNNNYGSPEHSAKKLHEVLDSVFQINTNKMTNVHQDKVSNQSFFPAAEDKKPESNNPRLIY